MENIIKTNELNIVGKLVEVKELKEGTYINAEGTEVPYVSTKLVIKVNAPADEEHLVELQSFTRKFKVDGTESKLFPRMLNIESLLNKQVSIIGSKDFNNGNIEENRYYSANKKDVVSFTRFNFVSIREAWKGENDCANFKFAGFVTKELELVEDGEGNPLHYAINIAQPKYDGKNLNVVTFIIEKDNAAAAKVMQANYKAFTTVEVGGMFKTVEVERKSEAAAESTAFGEAIPEILPPMVYRYLVITTGSQPVIGAAAYTEEDMKALLLAYKAQTLSIKEDAEKAATAKAPAATAAAKPKLSLNDLI